MQHNGADGGYASAGEIIALNIAVTNNNRLLTYFYNVVLADGGHPDNEQPYFNAWILDQNNDVIGCSVYTQECTRGTPPPGYTIGGSWNGPPSGEVSANVFYSGWQSNTVDLGNYNGTSYIGQTVQLQFMTAGCFPGGHFGYAYVDGIAGPNVLAIPATPPCAGANVTLSAPPMPPGTTYSWSSTGGSFVGGTTGSSVVVTSPAAGGPYTYTYTVAVTPAGLGTPCPFTTTGVMTFVAAPVASTTTVTNITCFGLTNGQATALPGGNTYLWAPGGYTAQTPNVLGVGTYTVTVSNASGCTSTSTAVITQPAAALTASVAGTNASCSNGLNGLGSATATPAGGTAAYTYAWSGGGGAAAIANNLGAGTYTVSVTDSKGCTYNTATVTIVVPQPAASITWNGTVAGADNWFAFAAGNYTNWTGGCLPTCASDVQVPVTANQPGIDNTGGIAACKTFNLVSGATLNFNAVAAELDICGDFNQSGTVYTGATAGTQGKLKFVGSVVQGFTAASTSVTTGGLFSVELANTASPLSELIIRDGFGNKDMIVSNSGTFKFTSGFIYTEGGRRLVLTNPLNTALSGYGPTKYVFGRINRALTLAGEGTYASGQGYDFPIGGSPVAGNTWPYELMNLNFSNVTNGATLTDVTVTFDTPPSYNQGTNVWPLNESDSPNNNSYGGGTGVYTAVGAGAICKVGGSGSGADAANGGVWTVLANPSTANPTYDMTLVGTNFLTNGGVMRHTILKRSTWCGQNACANCGWGIGASGNDGAFIDPGVGTAVGAQYNGVVGNSIKTVRQGLTGFSQFAQVQDASPLPIELLMFDASCTNNNVVVSWATASESMNNYFTLERTCDQNPFQFQTIATIPGAGNSSTLRQYSYVDKEVTLGECYYRLSQTDYDGKQTFFPLVSIDCKKNAGFNLVGVIPNPAVDELFVLFNTNRADIIHIGLTDMLGQELLIKNINPENGLNTVEMDISALGVGVYFVKVNNGTNSFIKKVVKK